MVTGEQIQAYSFGTVKTPIAEFDVLLNDGEALFSEELKTKIENAGGNAANYRYLTMQCAKDNAINGFVAKYSLLPLSKYDLSSSEGAKLTPLSQLILQSIEAKNLNIIAEEDNVNLHFVIFA